MQHNHQSNNAIDRFRQSDESHDEYIETILYRARNGIPTKKTNVLLPLTTEDDRSLLREYLAEIKATRHITMKRL
jgi:hypothetical protein